MASAYRTSLSNVIHLKRAYAEPDGADGRRYLVDRYWPRGVRKEELQLAGWLKDVAPSDKLRRWFDHDPERWLEFQQRFRQELDERPESWQPLLAAARQGNITLVYGARDMEHNNAVVLAAYLMEQMAS